MLWSCYRNMTAFQWSIQLPQPAHLRLTMQLLLLFERVRIRERGVSFRRLSRDIAERSTACTRIAPRYSTTTPSWSRSRPAWAVCAPLPTCVFQRGGPPFEAMCWMVEAFQMSPPSHSSLPDRDVLSIWSISLPRTAHHNLKTPRRAWFHFCPTARQSIQHSEASLTISIFNPSLIWKFVTETSQSTTNWRYWHPYASQ